MATSIVGSHLQVNEEFPMTESNVHFEVLCIIVASYPKSAYPGSYLFDIYPEGKVEEDITETLES